jgi:hypothetical protein
VLNDLWSFGEMEQLKVGFWGDRMGRIGLWRGDGGGEGDIPLPFDHFFFCFLPPEDAAGACCYR